MPTPRNGPAISRRSGSRPSIRHRTAISDNQSRPPPRSLRAGTARGGAAAQPEHVAELPHSRPRTTSTTTSTSGSSTRSADARTGQAGRGGGCGDGAAAVVVAAAAAVPGGEPEPRRSLPSLRHDERRSRFQPWAGPRKLDAWDVPVGYTFTKGRPIRCGSQINRQRAGNQSLRLRSGHRRRCRLPACRGSVRLGCAVLSFSTFESPRHGPRDADGSDLSSAIRSSRRIGHHALRVGGDYRHIRSDSRTDNNARGSYVFTGLYTGWTSPTICSACRSRPRPVRGRASSSSRSIRSTCSCRTTGGSQQTLTINAGVVTSTSRRPEADNRLVTLDTPAVSPRRRRSSPAAPARSTARFPTPSSPVRNDLAPRIGVAWRAAATVVAQATGSTTTPSPTRGSPATRGAAAVRDHRHRAWDARRRRALSAALCRSTGATTNNFGVDPNYPLGLVQIWNLDLQRDLTRTLNFGIGYVGTKGSNLDILRAPNRGRRWPAHRRRAAVHLGVVQGTRS